MKHGITRTIECPESRVLPELENRLLSNQIQILGFLAVRFLSLRFKYQHYLNKKVFTIISLARTTAKFVPPPNLRSTQNIIYVKHNAIGE